VTTRRGDGCDACNVTVRDVMADTYPLSSTIFTLDKAADVKCCDTSQLTKFNRISMGRKKNQSSLKQKLSRSVDILINILLSFNSSFGY